MDGMWLTAHSGMTWGATMIVPQAIEWGISIDQSATSMNYGILLQGFGGIFAVPLIEAYGRCASQSSSASPQTDISPVSPSGSGPNSSRWA